MDEKDISIEVVATKILVVRGKKVMLDRVLAEMWGCFKMILCLCLQSKKLPT